MTYKLIAIAALLGGATAANAGGIDRSGQSITALFENGRYAEFSLGAVSPDTSGVSTVFSGLAGQNSGNMTDNFFTFSAAYKADINDQLSYAIIYDQPFGADVEYDPNPFYFAGGAKAEFNSHAITGLLRYKLPSNVSFHVGIRVQTIEATATLPRSPGVFYDVKGDRDVGAGYVLGVAYEKPEIALRVSLTYSSKIKYDVDTVERVGGAVVLTAPTHIETPQSVNLEFQTGIMADTLLFGGVRWTDWSSFTIAPPAYSSPPPGGSGGPLLSYADDVFSYTLGVGRRLSDTWAVSASVGYEKSNGGFASNLGPTDGNKSMALAAVYSRDKMKITTGIRYINIGDAQTTLNGTNAAANFKDNEAVAIGIKVGFNF